MDRRFGRRGEALHRLYTLYTLFTLRTLYPLYTQGKRESSPSQEGTVKKVGGHLLGLDSTMQPDRANASTTNETKGNDFLVGLTP